MNAQITAIENFVTSGVKGIVVFPVDGNGVNDATQAAMDAGVVITANDGSCAADMRVSEDEHETGATLAQPVLIGLRPTPMASCRLQSLHPTRRRTPTMVVF